MNVDLVLLLERKIVQSVDCDRGFKSIRMIKW